MNVKRHAWPRPRRGFTLVEVVIVIGLIVLLAGLVLSVSVSVVSGAEVRETEQVLRLLDSALNEWETMADRKVSWGVDNRPGGAAYDMQQGTRDVFLITDLLNTIARPSQVRQIIAQINPDFVHTYHESIYPPWILQSDQQDIDDTWAVDNSTNAFSLGLAVLDAWDNPILAVHPGRLVNPSLGDIQADANPDGTIEHPVETVCGVAANRRLLLVSAGPDGEFGDLSGATISVEFKRTTDNVYSYKP